MHFNRERWNNVKKSDSGSRMGLGRARSSGRRKNQERETWVGAGENISRTEGKKEVETNKDDLLYSGRERVLTL